MDRTGQTVMSVGYRQLLERPFRRYARFGGRAGRAEFWLFVLVFILVTECSWLVGYGAASLVTGKMAIPTLMPAA